jgi:hypothetical protein
MHKTGRAEADLVFIEGLGPGASIASGLVPEASIASYATIRALAKISSPSPCANLILDQMWSLSLLGDSSFSGGIDVLSAIVFNASADSSVMNRIRL